MDLNVLTIIVSLGMLMWWLIKPLRDTLESLQEEVKQNGERIARIEGVIWRDINLKMKKNKEDIYDKVENVMKKEK